MQQSETFAIIPGIGGREEDFESLALFLSERDIETKVYQPELITPGSKKENLDRINQRDHEFSDLLAEAIKDRKVNGIITHSRGYILGLLAVQKIWGTQIPITLICPPANRRSGSKGDIRKSVEEDLGDAYPLHTDYSDRFVQRWENSTLAICAELNFLARKNTSFQDEIKKITTPIQVFANSSDHWYQELPIQENIIVNRINGSSHCPHVTHVTEVGQGILDYHDLFKTIVMSGFQDKAIQPNAYSSEMIASM